MRVVLSEHLISSCDQRACLEPVFLLRVPRAARGPYAHLPCGRGSHHGWLCPGTVLYTTCPNMLTQSWRQCGGISTALGPRGWALPLGQAFSMGLRCPQKHEHCGCYLGNPCTTFQDMAQTCLLSPYLKSGLGWLACWVGVGVSVWCFADRCNFIPCCELVGHQPAPSQQQVYYVGLCTVLTTATRLLVHCWHGFIQTQKQSEFSPTDKIPCRQTQTFMAFKVWKEY